jgi:DNA-binding MarR family transcriptional regulator
LTFDNLDRRENSAGADAARDGGAEVDDDAARARQEIGLLLRRLNVELDAVGQRFADVHGLNRTDVRALVAIMDAARRGEALTAGRLGEAVDLRSASVTALVDRLERVGHVRRVRDPEDRRRVALEMSESAMAAGAEHFGGLARDLVVAMEGYGDDELAVVRRWLEDMTAVITRHARAEPPPS